MRTLSVHLAEAGPRQGLAVLRGRPDPSETAGLEWAETMVTTPLPAGVPPRPNGVALIASWKEEAALDEFLDRHPLAERLQPGWHARLQPVRAYGAWPPLPGLGEPEQPVDDDEQVAVITLGRLRLRRAVPFFRASRAAEQQAAADPAAVLKTALARPPRILATFSVWRSAREMRDYAVGRSGAGHVQATRGHLQDPFHHESVFARFRPYGASGRWHGLAPAMPLVSARRGSAP
jgi:hypothetical protein